MIPIKPQDKAFLWVVGIGVFVLLLIGIQDLRR